MKLYSKIFLSFLLTLVLAELLIFGIFRAFIQEDRHQRFHRLAEAQAVIIKEWIAFQNRSRNCDERGRVYGARVDRDGNIHDDDRHADDHGDDDERREDEHDNDDRDHAAVLRIPRDRPVHRIQMPHGIHPEHHKRMQQAVERLSHLFRADVWISDHTGRPLARSFAGPVPPAPHYQQDFRNFSMGWGRRGEGFARMPIRLPDDRKGRIFAHIPPDKKTPLESYFAWALGGLGLAFAFLLIPISRMLTGPLKRLRHSALRLAAGDLTQRVDVKGKDEIGELGHAFNNMAEKIERMVRGSRELTAHVSHELRTPLARMRIAEEMLRDDIESGNKAQAERRADSIRAEIQDLDELIGKILTLSRLEMQTSPPQPEEIRLQELAAEMLERYRPTLEKKRIALTADLPEEAPAILAVRGELRTLLTNLLDNAVKFMPEGGDLRLSLAAADWEASEAAPRSLRIECENPAEPSPEMDLERIFEPFYRKTTNGAGGTGLGLAITKKIVDNMRGTIKVERIVEEDGERVRFVVILPLGS